MSITNATTTVTVPPLGVRGLLFRPIAVLISTLALSVLGVIVGRLLPVSLLPNVPVPELTVQVSYPVATAKALLGTVALPLRNQLLQLGHLADIEGNIQNGSLVFKLRFDYNTDMQLTYLETNEKIDGLLGSLPKDMPRPKVIKAGSGDIPVFNLNIWQSTKGNTTDFLALSDFCTNVLKRRLEQLPEIALTDATGLAFAEVQITPFEDKMQSLGISNQQLIQFLENHQLPLANVSIKEGQYEYNFSIKSGLKTPEEILGLSMNVGGRIVQLNQLLAVNIQEQKPLGIYTFNGQRAVCLSIIKQSDAQLLKLRTEIQQLLLQFRADYPDLRFEISQDQTELLSLSINNLISNILTGAVLTFLMIFFFIPNRRIPFLIGIVIPVSLSLTFLSFYVLGLSINIVSLAGLVLGIGEIIDSAIILIESINEQRQAGKSLDQACIDGTNEVISPLFTSVITNSLVFLPLIFLSGLAGALFFDQALSVTLALGSSLLTSYILVPVLYRLLFLKQEKTTGYVAMPQTWLSKKIEGLYLQTFNLVFKAKFITWILALIILFGGYWASQKLPKASMPNISRSEFTLEIDWNEPLSVAQNQARILALSQVIKTPSQYISAFVGNQQFILGREAGQSAKQSKLSIRVANNQYYQQIQAELKRWLSVNYGNATLRFSPAKNVFEQLFGDKEPELQLRVFSNKSQQSPSLLAIDEVAKVLKKQGILVAIPSQDTQLMVSINDEKLLLYQVNAQDLIQKLNATFDNTQLGTLQSEQGFVPLRLNNQNTNTTLNLGFVNNQQGQSVAIASLVTIKKINESQQLFLGKEGAYFPLEISTKGQNPAVLITKINQSLASQTQTSHRFAGTYFQNIGYINELLWTLLVAIGLLFCVLTAQFESLRQPFIVMITALLGISGALLTLWFTGQSLNAMSIIGIVVLLGLIDNDAILKIDTINKAQGQTDLVTAIRLSGKRRLTSQLMTYLTTILGLLPVLFSGGLGSELQQPLALTVIGGMTLGVLASWTIIPLFYFAISKFD